MSGNDNLLKSFAMFSNGMKELAASMAVKDARQQLAEVHAQGLKEDETFAMSQRVGQDLALRLSQAGSSPDQIAAATQGLVPSANNVYTTSSQAKMQSAGHDFQGGQNDKDRKLQWDIANLRINKEGAGQPSIMDETMERELAKEMVEFNRKELPVLGENIGKLETALSIITDKKNAKMTGPGQSLTPDVIQSYTNKQNLVAKNLVNDATAELMKPTLGSQFTAKEGEQIKKLKYNEDFTPEENAKIVKQYQGFLKKKRDFGTALTKHLQSGGSYKDFDFAKYGMEPVGGGAGGTQTAAPKGVSSEIQAAEAWLKDPKNANHPKWSDVQKKLSIMKGR